ncbi:ATP-binding protein [Hamadaea tsunoensis]|uniref:ATP-binding protein n=1 Tax=Hamadaea tsunoensis TaxID=53368 RepID=UPI000403CDA9|nr:AAA family ATPase [Hamadaea tsunoensis]
MGMVGRAGALAELTALAVRAGTGHGGVALVRGEPGIGKSTIVEALADTAAELGLRPLWGWCAPGEPAVYLPWRTVLGGLGHAGLLDGPATGASAVARLRLQSAVAERLAGDGPVIVIIEDLHWADEASLDLVNALATRCRTMPLLLVATARDDPELRPAVAERLAALPTHALRLPLAGLTAADVGVLLTEVLAAPPPAEVVNEVCARTGGNPFFVREVARLLHHQGVRGAVPVGVREVLERRLARLSQDCHRLLQVAALGGTDVVDVPLLVSVAGTGSAAETRAVLDEAVVAGLLRTDDTGVYAFAHALVREVLGIGLPGADRGGLHAAYARALEPRAADDDAYAVVVAEHWSRAAEPAEQLRSGPWWVAAGRAAAARLGYEAAARHFRRALEQPIDHRTAVLLDLGAAQWFAGDADEARTTFLTAAAAARAEGDSGALARAALGVGGGLAGFEIRLYDHEAIRVLRSALDLLPPDAVDERAALLARLSVSLTEFAPVEERARIARTALDLTESGVDVPVRVSVLAAYCDAIAGPEHRRERLDAATRMRVLAESVGDTAGTLLAGRLRVVALCEGGEFQAADQEIAEYARLAETLGVPLYTWLPHIWRGMRALLRGDVPAAFAAADRAEDLGVRADSMNATFMVFALRAAAHRTAGTTGSYAAEVRALMEPLIDSGVAPAMAAAGGWEFLPPVRARALVTAALQAVGEIPRDSEWLETVWSLGQAAIAYELPEGIAATYAALRPYAGLWAVDGIGGAVWGVVSDQLGRLATALGDPVEAATWYAQARDAYREAQTPLLAAALPDPGPAAPTPSTVEHAALVRDGRLWHVTFRGRSVSLPDAKGLHDLRTLLDRPGREVHVLDLADPTGTARTTAGDAGPVLDGRARSAYRARITELGEQTADAEADGDTEKAARLRTEQEFILAELAGALGLHGRDRPAAADAAERARKAVTMRLRATIRTLAAEHPVLGRHLDRSIETGRFCAYRPETTVVWRTG